MSWTLSVSARKGDLADAIDRAEPVHKGELHPAADQQVAAVKALVKAVLPTYDEDAGMVGLYATGGGGTPQGLVSISLSVASEAYPPEPVAAAPEHVVEGRQAVPGRYAPGERPEAPGQIDEAAVAAAAQAAEDDPRRAAYRPDVEPDAPADQPTSLAEDAKRAAAAKAAERKPAGRK